MSSLQNRMYNYEMAPPAGSWDKIVAALDESSAENEFPARLYEMEVTPPYTAWEAISATFDKKEEKVIPLRKRAIIFFRYAAAAIFLGFVTIGIFKWTGTSNNSFETTTAKAGSSKKDTAISKENNVATQSEKEINPDLSGGTSENNNMTAKAERREKSVIKNVSHVSTTGNKNRYNSTTDNENADPLYAYNDHVADISNRYIMLMTPDGNIIRMSKKWSGLVCCVSGEEQDEDCKNQIKKWQKKLATSSVAPSSGNFLDILDLVNSLEEGVDM
jgi:hypothetical protein